MGETGCRMLGSIPRRAAAGGPVRRGFARTLAVMDLGAEGGWLAKERREGAFLLPLSLQDPWWRSVRVCLSEKIVLFD